MNTHDKYELPPLPEPLCNLPTYCQNVIRQYTRSVLDDQDATTEADRKRMGEPDAFGEALAHAVEGHLQVLDAYPDQLVPVNRKSASVNAMRRSFAAIEADRQTQATLYANQYLSLTDAMGYESDSGLSPEEWAATLRADRQARGEPVGYVSSQAVLCNFPICLPADLFQTEEELLQEYPEAMPMPVYTAPQPQQQVTGEPTLDAPAQVGNIRFFKGIKWSTVIGAAQRHHAYMTTPEKEQERIQKAADFAKRAQEGTESQPPQTHEGYKLVPIEPTEEMLFACQDAGSISNHQRGKRIYKAMLEAAPEPKEK